MVAPVSPPSTPRPIIAQQQWPAEEFGNTPPPTDPRVTWIGDALTIQALRLTASDSVAAGREVIYICGATLSVQQALELLATRADVDNRAGGVIVLALGTFGPVAHRGLGDLLRTIGTHRRVILVAPAVLSRAYPWVPEVHSLYRSEASSSPDISYIDWQQQVSVHPDLLAPNGATFSVWNRGGQAWLDAINLAIEKAYRPTLPSGEPPSTGTG
jgi:hypothetical protein